MAFDSAHALPECLGALRRTAFRRSWSTTPRRTTRRGRRRAGARVIRNARNEGYGRANNIGAGRRRASSCSSSIRTASWRRRGRGGSSMRRGAIPMRLLRAADRRAERPRVLPAALAAGALSANPGGKLVLPEGEACAPFFSGACFLIRRDLFLASAASTRTSSCSTRTTTSAAGSRIPAPRSSMCRRPSCATGAALERPEAGPDLHVPLAPGLVAGLCEPQIRASRTRRPACSPINALKALAAA